MACTPCEKRRQLLREAASHVRFARPGEAMLKVGHVAKSLIEDGSRYVRFAALDRATLPARKPKD